MNDVAIKVNNVSKNFHYTSGRAGTIKSAFTNVFKSKESKNKDVQHALKDISFEIKKGEFFGIVGRNGSGKSTLLKMIAGIYQPNAGTIEVQGKLVPFIELGVGFNPELTGRENVYLNGALLGFTRKEVEAQYQEIVEFAELEKFMDQQLKNYSSGMQVRLAFSMAVRAKADILLIDEVLAVGDADFQRKCFEYFKQLKKQKKTVIFVSHDMSAVREYCDRAVLIENAKKIAIGEVDSVAQQYTQLFAKTEGSVQINGGTSRWGTGDVTTTKVKTKVNETFITITQAISSTMDVDNIVVGIRLKDSDGTDILGTNTKIEGIELPVLRKNTTISLSWKFPNILSDGRYSIDPAILLTDGITVSDWWNDACVFQIKKGRHMPYKIDPGFQIKVSVDSND